MSPLRVKLLQTFYHTFDGWPMDVSLGSSSDSLSRSCSMWTNDYLVGSCLSFPKRNSLCSRQLGKSGSYYHKHDRRRFNGERKLASFHSCSTSQEGCQALFISAARISLRKRRIRSR